MHDPEFHSHEQASARSAAELQALLKYMADHTRHHAGELHELAHSAPEAAQVLLHDACDCLQSGVVKMEEALKLLKGE